MNLSALTPSDFESLAADLLSTVLDVRFERFGEGRDGGIDFQYQHITKHGEERWVGQAKRYADTQVLIRQMKAEHEKMQKLPRQTARYFLVTSCSLLPNHKEQIMAIMSLYIVSTGDIYGAEDISAILAEYPALYGRHHRLWLHSIEQLNQQLYAASYTRSRIALQRAFDSSEYFIEHSQVAAIQQCLDEQHACLIVGDPGSGKTTTAGEIALHYFVTEPGLELHWFSDRSFDEALNLVRIGTRQLFVFDDCFGATFLTDEKAVKQRQDWSALVRFAEKSDKELRLIFTTRDYILQQALRQMRQHDPCIAALLKEVVRIDASNVQFRIDLTLQTLARSGLTGPALQQLIDEQLYWPLVTDQRFSPRMLELLCARLPAVTPDQLKAFIHNSLASPDNLWRNAYTDLGPAAQTLILLVGISRDYCESNELLSSFLQLYQRLYGRQVTTREFEQALLEAEPVFIKTRAEHESIWLSVANPGVHDFVYKELNANKPYVDSIIDSLSVFSLGIDSFAIRADSHKPIRLQPAQTKALLKKLVELLPQASSSLVQSTDTGQWIKHTQKLGRRLTSLWLEVLHDEQLAHWLYAKLVPLLPVGSAWKTLVVESDMTVLLNLSGYADRLTQADIWNAACSNLLNSEDAAALAELYARHQEARQVLGKKKPFANKLLSACMKEIARVDDIYHLDAIMKDLYRIEEVLDTDISEPKYMIYEALDPYQNRWDETVESDPETSYYADPELFEDHERLLDELKGAREYAKGRAREWLL